MKKIVLTGGGTAGHVTPNIALLPALREMGCEIHYIGDTNGMEKGLLAPFEDVTYHGVSTGKLRRYLSVQNLKDPFKVLRGISQCKKLLGRLRPDVIFAKGGFVSVPVVLAAKKYKIPVVLHESDFTMGLANRISAPRATIVCTSFAPTLKEIKGGHGVWTGSPVREELLHATKAQAQAFFKFPSPELPTLVFMGGSLGAQALNAALKQSFAALTERYNLIHIAGKGNVDAGLSHPNYRVYEYLSGQMPLVFAAADLFVCRSGANTLFELLATQRPGVLVPLPSASSRGDQLLNADFFKEQGYADVLPQEDITPQTLLSAIEHGLATAEGKKQAMRQSPMQNGTQNVLNQIKIAAGWE